MFQDYRDRAEFLFVYIREAHPSDGWQLDDNERDHVIVAQPTTFGQRRSVALRCSQALQITMPCVVDDMNNTADEAYAAWPERLYVVDSNGFIAFAGKQGPFGFKPAEIDAWLRKHVGPPKADPR